MDALDRTAIGVGKSARGGFVWVAAAAVAARLRGEPAIVAETAVSVWTADLLALGLSHLVGRKRPCADGAPALIDCPQTPSLPSNHASSAFAAALTLTRREPGAGPFAFAAAAAVGASRVRVGVHHPGDVVAGATLGAAVSVGVAAAFERLSWLRLLRALA